jgi:hypothetical protein
MGVLIDAEADGKPDDRAGQDGSGGDDNDGDPDEDGVSVIASLVATDSTATTSSFAVTASAAAVAGGTGKLDAWIDFNQDGDWDDNGEQIFASEDIGPGLNILSFAVPTEATPGDTAARFRINSAGGLNPTGLADDGEVEDYLVTILDGDAAGGATGMIAPPVSGSLDVLADGNDVVVRRGTFELFRAPGASLSRLDTLGLDGDDTLNVANLDAIFGGIVGGDAGNGNDKLNLTGSGQHLDLTQVADADIQGLETIDITGSGDNILTLDLDEVVNISPTAETLRVVHDDGDTVNYGDGWTVKLPRIVVGQYVHVLTQDNAIVEVANTLPFQNPFLRLDMNLDGFVSPLDALVTINRLNTNASTALPTPTSVDELAELFYFDATGDGSVSPLDALVVINFLNNPTGVAEGEFGFSLPTVVVSSTAHISPTRTDIRREDSKRRLPSLDLSTTPHAQHAPAVDTPHIERSGPADGRSSGTCEKELVSVIDEFFAFFDAARG